MNFLKPFEHRIEPFRVRHSPPAWLAALSLTMAVAFYPSNSSLAQESFTDEPWTQVLTRGPVHEAFAGVISYDSVPGIVVKNAPPALIEEISPNERPVGEDVTWIPGYWAWDDERNDFLWISGIWRALPPGREWIVGYWAETTEGYQWTSGFWADVTTTETTYLPPPPIVLKKGQTSKHPQGTMAGHRGTGLGVRSAMPGAPVIGQRAGQTGIGFLLTMCGPGADMCL